MAARSEKPFQGHRQQDRQKAGKIDRTETDTQTVTQTEAAEHAAAQGLSRAVIGHMCKDPFHTKIVLVLLVG
jgi:hypothetical protein